MKNLMEKIAVVTGASRGIGRSIAEGLAMDGALVVVHFGQNSEAAEATVSTIKSNGGLAISIQADLTRLGDIKRFYETLDGELKQRLGTNTFDILVNNAGIASPASYREITGDQFDQLFAVNVRGPFFLTQAAVPRLRTGGRIINISSVASRHASPSPMVPPYSMSKAALDAFTRGLAQDLGSRKITANTIAPGAVETDMNSRFLRDPAVRKGIEQQTALARIGETTDIANIARFLASDESQWMTGQYIEASGGFRL
jgi:3-oxoacyl-[acyl-carrier protein] reductase